MQADYSSSVNQTHTRTDRQTNRQTLMQEEEEEKGRGKTVSSLLYWIDFRSLCLSVCVTDFFLPFLRGTYSQSGRRGSAGRQADRQTQQQIRDAKHAGGVAGKEEEGGGEEFLP